MTDKRPREESEEGKSAAGAPPETRPVRGWMFEAPATVAHAITAFALAIIERLGSESPARMLAENPYMLHELAEYMTPMTIRIVAFERYRQRTRVWRLLSDGSWKPGERGPMQYSATYTLIGSRIYAIDWIPVPATMAVYDYALDEWRTLPPLPAWVAVTAAVFVIDGMLHVFATNTGISQHAVYEPALNKWIVLVSVRNTRCFAQVLAVGQDAYAVGTGLRSRERDVRSMVASKFDLSGATLGIDHWGPEHPKSDLQAVTVQGQIYTFTSGSVISIYNPITGAWSTTGTPVPAWWDKSARVTSVGQLVYASVYGLGLGWRIEIFDTETGRWHPGPAPPPGIGTDMHIVALGLDVPFREDPRRITTHTQ
ncbi:MAG: hypothetical protein M0R22_10975, partial [Dehalococcoidia bacterium]|nr:hypothetical protein [Dehalococcoidia bacterium]